jgi:Flp pilus assembly protein CpaB
MANETKGSSSMIVVAVVVGLLVSVGLFGGGGLVFSELWGERAAKRARLGWALKPVLVAAHDLAPGDVLQPGDLVPRDIPEQFITDTVLRPGDSAERQVVLVPVTQGAAMRWPYLGSPEQPVSEAAGPAWSACQQALQQRGGWPKETTSNELFERLRSARLGGEEP